MKEKGTYQRERQRQTERRETKRRQKARKTSRVAHSYFSCPRVPSSCHGPVWLVTAQQLLASCATGPRFTRGPNGPRPFDLRSCGASVSVCSAESFPTSIEQWEQSNQFGFVTFQIPCDPGAPPRSRGLSPGAQGKWRFMEGPVRHSTPMASAAVRPSRTGNSRDSRAPTSLDIKNTRRPNTSEWICW